MKRLFIAIKIQPDSTFLEQLRLLKTHLHHEKIKWVEGQNIHVTLKFLGDTDGKMIPEIERALNIVAKEHSAFGIRLEKLGIFGSRYDPRVIWVGIDPYDELVSLMQKVHKSLEPAGFESDRQNLIPHLTLGRIKELKDKILFQKIMDQFREISSVKMEVNNFILYESILKKEGPAYIALNSFDFRK
jgi:RNA 2',3'-cyclic 3'-phosphodiesterase